MGDMGAGSGMLIVETIAKIGRAHFAQKKPIKAICREFRVSRKVVRKVIRSGATEFRYERGKQPLPCIDPWRGQLDGLLLANEGRSSRERLTLIRMFEELRGLGYEGGYDAVRRYAKKWRVERGAATAEAYVPLSFAPGEAYQFDWSHEVVLINGTTVSVKVAHVRLCHSRILFVRAYPRETQEMVFDAHNRAFAFFKGTSRAALRTRGGHSAPRVPSCSLPGQAFPDAVPGVPIGCRSGVPFACRLTGSGDLAYPNTL